MGDGVRRYSPLLAGWLFVVWLLLWRSTEPLVLVSGVLVSVLVLLLFPLRPVRSPLFLRPHRVLGLVLYLGWDLLTSGVRVGWDAARYGPKVSAIIVEAPILVDRDFLVASAANMLSLGPGKFVLHIDRPQGCFYVYVLGVHASAVEEYWHDAMHMQVRVAKAFGTSDEIRAAQDRARRLRFETVPQRMEDTELIREGKP